MRTLYVRCKTAREIYDLMKQGKIRCMSCEELLCGAGELTCKCGGNYACHTCQTFYRENKISRGAASPIFNRYKTGRERREARRKRCGLDCLLHECPVTEISDAEGCPVGVNLIEGTKPQIVTLLERLAGNGN